MGYPTDVNFTVTPGEHQSPKPDNKTAEMVQQAAVNSAWMYDSNWYHGPNWIELDPKLVEMVRQLSDIHGDPACPSVATISDASIYYLNSCGDRFVDMMKDHFGHGPDNSTWWTHTWEAEIITDEDREELRELLDYFETELDHEYYIPMGFVGKIKIDAER